MECKHLMIRENVLYFSAYAMLPDFVLSVWNFGSCFWFWGLMTQLSLLPLSLWSTFLQMCWWSSWPGGIRYGHLCIIPFLLFVKHLPCVFYLQCTIMYLKILMLNSTQDLLIKNLWGGNQELLGREEEVLPETGESLVGGNIAWQMINSGKKTWRAWPLVLFGEA